MPHRTAAAILATALTAGLPIAPACAQAQKAATARCDVDLNSIGQMHDIISNALERGFGKPNEQVRAFLARTRPLCETSQQLLEKSAAEFGVEVHRLAAEVERFRHVNCTHEGGGEHIDLKMTDFARHVMQHVVLHELGHALVREFDLPILGNEETLADAFATHYLVTHAEDRALPVLKARIDSLMFEARERPRHEWTVKGEHNSDARRAYQIAALALAADREKYLPLARTVGMLDREIRGACDYGAEIHRSWRRILRPLWMPAGQQSKEVRIRVDDFDGEFGTEIRAANVAQHLADVMRRFDWHSQVTLHFKQGSGGAGWSRGRRTITVHASYLQRFVRQGEALARKD